MQPQEGRQISLYESRKGGREGERKRGSKARKREESVIGHPWHKCRLEVEDKIDILQSKVRASKSADRQPGVSLGPGDDSRLEVAG